MLPLPAALVNSVSAFDKFIPHLRKTLSQKPPSCVAWRRSQTDYIFSVCLCHLFLFVQKKCGNNNKNLNSTLSFRILTDSPPLFLSSIKKSPNACGEYAVFTTETSRFFSYTSIISQSISKNRRFLIAYRKTIKAFQKNRLFLIAFRKTTRAFQKNRHFFNCFLQNTKSISKSRTFFILVIINNGGCKKLAPLTTT